MSLYEWSEVKERSAWKINPTRTWRNNNVITTSERRRSDFYMSNLKLRKGVHKKYTQRAMTQ